MAESEPEAGMMGWGSTLQPIWTDGEQQQHHNWRQGCGRGWWVAGLLGWLFAGAENKARSSAQMGHLRAGLAGLWQNGRCLVVPEDP